MSDWANAKIPYLYENIPHDWFFDRPSLVQIVEEINVTLRSLHNKYVAKYELIYTVYFKLYNFNDVLVTVDDQHEGLLDLTLNRFVLLDNTFQ